MTLEESIHYKSCVLLAKGSFSRGFCHTGLDSWMGNVKQVDTFKGSEGSDVSSKKMIHRAMKSYIECWWKHTHACTHTHAVSALSGTHTSFPETYLLSHTPRSLSNPPWWRLMAALRACWAPPVKARGPPGQLPSVLLNKGASRSQIHHKGSATGWISGARQHSWTTNTRLSVRDDRNTSWIRPEPTGWLRARASSSKDIHVHVG